MALNTTGTISIGGTTVGQSVELELGMSGTVLASLNDNNFRTLATVPSGAITLNNFYGKSNGGSGGSGNRITPIQQGGWVVWMYQDPYNGSYGSATTVPWVKQNRTITRFQNTGGASLILGVLGYYVPQSTATLTIDGVSQTYMSTSNNGTTSTWFYFNLVGLLAGGLHPGTTYLVDATFT